MPGKDQKQNRFNWSRPIAKPDKADPADFIYKSKRNQPSRKPDTSTFVDETNQHKETMKE